MPKLCTFAQEGPKQRPLVRRKCAQRDSSGAVRNGTSRYSVELGGEAAGDQCCGSMVVALSAATLRPEIVNCPRKRIMAIASKEVGIHRLSHFSELHGYMNASDPEGRDFGRHFFQLLRLLRRRNSRFRHTFASGGSAIPSDGRKSGRSRRATPIRLSAIP